MTLIPIFLIVLLMRWYKSVKSRTYSFPLYSVVRHLDGKTTLHMRFKYCPVGNGALKKIYIELKKTLIEMKTMGYTKVSFTSHLFQDYGIEKLCKFLSANNMQYSHMEVIPTPWTHVLSNKIVMYMYTKKIMKVHRTSLVITITF
ncbi:hypothetical protein NS381_09480 [Pantoea stewartii]|nr:hypothetical protein NS381_09480 [Pantoea stewartii]